MAFKPGNFHSLSCVDGTESPSLDILDVLVEFSHPCCKGSIEGGGFVHLVLVELGSSFLDQFGEKCSLFFDCGFTRLLMLCLGFCVPRNLTSNKCLERISGCVPNGVDLVLSVTALFDGCFSSSIKVSLRFVLEVEVVDVGDVLSESIVAKVEFGHLLININIDVRDNFSLVCSEICDGLIEGSVPSSLSIIGGSLPVLFLLGEKSGERLFLSFDFCVPFSKSIALNRNEFFFGGHNSLIVGLKHLLNPLPEWIDVACPHSLFLEFIELGNEFRFESFDTFLDCGTGVCLSSFIFFLVGVKILNSVRGTDVSNELIGDSPELFNDVGVGAGREFIDHGLNDSSASDLGIDLLLIVIKDVSREVINHNVDSIDSVLGVSSIPVDLGLWCGICLSDEWIVEGVSIDAGDKLLNIVTLLEESLIKAIHDFVTVSIAALVCCISCFCNVHSKCFARLNEIVSVFTLGPFKPVPFFFVLVDEISSGVSKSTSEEKSDIIELVEVALSQFLGFVEKENTLVAWGILVNFKESLDEILEVVLFDSFEFSISFSNAVSDPFIKAFELISLEFTEGFTIFLGGLVEIVSLLLSSCLE